MTDNTTTPTRERRPRFWRGLTFRLGAVLVGLLPFLLLEMGLVLFDVGNPTHHADPFVGFSTIHPLFERQDDQYVTTLSRELTFGIQRFAANKPSQGYRIFCLGGSTVRGRPYETDTAFPAWLELELNGCDSTRTYEVVNCGGVSYASYRLRYITDEVLNYQPDLIILATGHNEFLEDRTYQAIKSRSAVRSWFTDRVYSLRTVTLARHWLEPRKKDERTILPEEVKARLDQGSGYASYHRDEVWRTNVIQHYQHSVQRMISACKTRQVPIILVDLGSNIRDCPPFKSEHKHGLSPSDLNTWETKFAVATEVDNNNARSLRAGGTNTPELKKALQLYREAEAVDDEYALLLYRIARCLDRLGKHQEARKYYLKAQDHDICPLRMPTAVHDLLHQLARDNDVPLIPARALLAQSLPHQLPGLDLYVDHVHPTIGSHQRIARALFQQIREAGLVSATSTTWNPHERRGAYRNHIQQLGRKFFSDSHRRLGWLEHWARRDRFQKETFPVDPAGDLRHGRWHLEIDQDTRAWQAYHRALTANPQLMAVVLQHAREFVSQGRTALARKLVKKMMPGVLDPALRKQFQLASLVIALEMNDQDRAVELYKNHQKVFEEFRGKSTPWLELTPDLFERAERLVGR